MFCVCAISATWWPVRQVDALLLRGHLVPVEVGRALLEFGEVLDGPQRPFGAVNLLVEHPRRLTVSMRKRWACGRVSGFR